MRAIVRPLSNPKACIDVTECLLDALAAEISRLSEGNPVLDRLEAEARLDELLGAMARWFSAWREEVTVMLPAGRGDRPPGPGPGLPWGDAHQSWVLTQHGEVPRPASSAP